MSIESKIKELLTRSKDAEQLNEEGMGPAVGKDTSIKAANAGDATSPRQGSSQDASYEEREETEENQGAVAAKSTPSSPRPQQSGAGNAPNYTTVADPTSVVNMTASSGNKPMGESTQEVESVDEAFQNIPELALQHHPLKNGKPQLPAKIHSKHIHLHHISGKVNSETAKYKVVANGKNSVGSEMKVGSNISGSTANDLIDDAHSLPDHKVVIHTNTPKKYYMGESEQQKFSQSSLKEQLTAIFGDDLSEDFRDKATAIFEAAVIARVNEEMEKVSSKLEEQSQAKLEEMTEGLVDKVDSFMNYVVEQWMEENKLEVENGLRTEIAEDFMLGLKALFQENYIEVPEEKIDVVEELQSTSEALEEKLNQSLSKNIELTEELSNLKKAIVLSEMSGDLADTEAEKLNKLVEGVQYDSDELFREKVKVIKENYFPKAQKTSPEEQLLNEEAPIQGSADPMSKYVQALTRAIKAR